MAKYARVGAATALAILISIPAVSHAASDTDLADVRKQIEILNQRRAEDAQRIQDLEARLARAEEATRQVQDSTKQALAAAAMPPPQAQSAPASAGAFNPAISAVLDGRFGVFSRNPNTYSLAGFPLATDGPGQRGLFLGEAEVNAQANIDDLFMGSLTFSLAQNGGKTDVDLEESYIQTLTLPLGFQVTAGKMLSDIGYLNSFHTHADDFADRPLAYRAFLADEFNDVGVRVTWLAPTNIYMRIGGEAFRGDSYPAAGAARGGVGAKTAYVRIGDDLGTEVSYQVGASWLWTDAVNRITGDAPDTFTGSTDTGIAHLVVKWAPGGNFVERNFKFQTELLKNHIAGFFDGVYVNRTDYGIYSLAIYQFMPQWRIGYRFDWMSAGDIPTSLAFSTFDSQSHNPTRQSVMLEYDHSEFSRLRLQYNYDRSRAAGSDSEFLLQYTVTLGAHPAHSY